MVVGVAPCRLQERIAAVIGEGVGAVHRIQALQAAIRANGRREGHALISRLALEPGEALALATADRGGRVAAER